MPNPSPAVESVVRSLLDAKMRGDREAISALLSPSSSALAIGTEAGEWWAGPDEFFRAHCEASPFAAEIVELTAHEAGTAAWAAASVEVVLDAQQRLPVRVSVVLEKTHDGWKAVHTHASVASEATW
jgi:hypothetical protein